MLFQLSENTPLCSIFTELNIEVLYFFSESIEQTVFSRSLFTETLGQAIWNNLPTRSRFEAVWNTLPAGHDARRDIYCELSMAQKVSSYFDDTTKNFPVINDDLHESIKKLAKHLFERTKDLVGVCEACDDESIAGHFDAFRDENGNICTVCGTSRLTQIRAGSSSEEQWRGPYDHLLDKATYPIFGVHPGNLVPICDTCNSKAKGRKQLLVGATGRRVCFYPYYQCCRDEIEVRLVDHDACLQFKVECIADDPVTIEMIQTWDDVYQVCARVEGEFADFVTTIANDCRPQNFDDLKEQITRRTNCSAASLRQEGWLFWKTRLYQWLHAQGDELISELWDMYESRTDDDAHQAVFGV